MRAELNGSELQGIPLLGLLLFSLGYRAVAFDFEYLMKINGDYQICS
jgi:hypothetical protein